jgi:SulP family sulfate permease
LLAGASRGSMLPDTVAGLTLAAIAISESMGYAKIAGMPPITGLYTGLLPVVAFALLGSSRKLVVGADSATAAILFAALSGLGIAGLVPGSPTWVLLASAVACLAGLVVLLVGIARLGFLANFLSRSALLGLFAGIGISVAVSQLGDMLGIGTSGVTWHRLYDIGRDLGHVEGAAAITAAAALAILVVLRVTAPRVPAALVVAVAGIAVSGAAHLSSHGVAVVGQLTGGLPRLRVPNAPWSQVSQLTVAIFAIAMIALTQSAATSRSQAAADGVDVDDNADLRGLGLANLLSGLSGSFPVSGSPTKTRVVVESGSRSQAAQLVSAAVTLVVLLVATGLIARLPAPVLAAVVFVIGVDLVDVTKLRRVARVRRDEFAVAVLTGLAVLGFGVEAGMVAAVLLSLVILVGRVYRPYTAVLVPGPPLPGTDTPNLGTLHELAPEPGVVTLPGLVVFRFGARLFYANVHPFYRTVLGLVNGAQPTLRCLVLDLRAVGDIDYTASDMLVQLHREITGQQIRFVLAGVDEETRTLLERLGLLDVFDPADVYERLRQPIEEYAAGPLPD